MEDQRNTDSQPEEKKTPQFRGLYEHVHVSVRTLDIVIVCCVLVILVVLAIEMQDPGFTINFDSRGGTDVAIQNQMYGEQLIEPEPPTREGYEFTGWYRDPACYDKWVVAVDVIEGNLTLYAGWKPIEP